MASNQMAVSTGPMAFQACVDPTNMLNAVIWISPDLLESQVLADDSSKAKIDKALHVANQWSDAGAAFQHGNWPPTPMMQVLVQGSFVLHSNAKKSTDLIQLCKTAHDEWEEAKSEGHGGDLRGTKLTTKIRM